MKPNLPLNRKPNLNLRLRKSPHRRLSLQLNRKMSLKPSNQKNLSVNLSLKLRPQTSLRRQPNRQTNREANPLLKNRLMTNPDPGFRIPNRRVSLPPCRSLLYRTSLCQKRSPNRKHRLTKKSLRQVSRLKILIRTNH